MDKKRKNHLSFSDITMWERHTLLENTIGTLNMENDSLQIAQFLAWFSIPVFIILTLFQVLAFSMYNGPFHPLTKVLDGKGNSSKGEYKLQQIRNFFSNLLNTLPLLFQVVAQQLNSIWMIICK